MKKILVILSALLLCSCSNNDVAELDNVEAIDVINQMFEISQVDRFGMEKIYDVAQANNALNISTNMSGEETYQLDNFVSGAEAAPMMMLDTDCIIVLELSDTSNIDKVKELIRGNQSRGICVVADDEDVEVVSKDNFVCFIASKDHKDDFVNAFNEVDFKNYQYQTDTAFGKMMSDYKENTNSLVDDIYRIDDISYILNPDSEYSFTDSDITTSYVMADENNYDLEVPVSSYIYLIVEVNNNKEEVQEAMENLAVSGKIISYNYDIDNLNESPVVISQDNYLILEIA